MKQLLLIFLLFTVSLSAQEIQWEKNLGQTKSGEIADVIQTIDGQIALIGNEDDGTCYLEVLRMADGTSVFSKPLIFEQEGVLKAIAQAYDGTFIIVGHRKVADKKTDSWWLKVDENGRLLENKTFGGKEDDSFNDVIIAADGNVVMVGYQTIDGVQKAWWVKTNMDGALPRMETYESIKSKRDEARAVVQGANGRFVITGITEPEKGYDANVWIMDVDEEGEHTVADLYTLFDETQIVGEGKKQQSSKLWEESTGIVALQNGGYAISGFQGPGEKRKNWLAVLNAERKIAFNSVAAIGEYSGEEEGHAIAQLFNGNIVIGGFTKGYERGANTSRLFLKLVDGTTYEQSLDIIYFDKPNKSERITQVYPTHNGDLLVAGEKYNDKKGAWIGYYNLNQGTVFNNNSTLTAIISTKTHNQNDVLEVNENGYGFLELKNTGYQDLFGLEIKVSGYLPNGVSIYKTIFVNELLGKQCKNIGIPIVGDENITIDKADLEIRIQDKKGKTLETLSWSFFTGEAPLPNLEVMTYDFETVDNKIVKGSNFDLVLEIKNTGRAAAIQPTLDLKLPKGVKSATSWDISRQKIDVNETVSLRIPLSVIQDYASSLVTINSTINAKNQIIPTKRQFTVTVNEPPKVEDFFVDINWLQPNIGFIEQNAFQTTSGKFGVSIQFFSNIPVDEDKIKLYINNNLVKGARLGEVSLKKSRVDNGNSRTTYLYERQIVLTQRGRNVIEFRYKDDRLPRTSTSERLNVNFEEKRPILYILAIGPEYKENLQLSRLTYTKNDAEAFIQAFESQIGENRFFDTIIITKLLGADADAYNIKKSVVEMANNARASQRKTMILTYISSHGDIDDKGNFIIMAEDYNKLNEVTYVRYKEDIVDKLSVVDDSNRLIFIDACKSGAANSVDAVVTSSKGLSSVYLSKQLDKLIQVSGFVTFASCNSEEISWEDAKWRNGAFTEAMLEAFEDESVAVSSTNKMHADKDNDGILTIGEFMNFVQLRVPYIVKETKNQTQNPVISEKEGLDISTPFYILD